MTRRDEINDGVLMNVVTNADLRHVESLDDLEEHCYSVIGQYSKGHVIFISESKYNLIKYLYKNRLCSKLDDRIEWILNGYPDGRSHRRQRRELANQIKLLSEKLTEMDRTSLTMGKYYPERDKLVYKVLLEELYVLVIAFEIDAVHNYHVEYPEPPKIFGWDWELHDKEIKIEKDTK